MLKSIGVAVLFLLYALTANAASLIISPTSVERVAPDRAAVFHLRNQVSRPIGIEVRVLRWSNEGGVEQLKPTNDVVVSPPSVRLPPNGNRVVSVVRVSKEPLRSQETYRVVIDELPDPTDSTSGAESVAVQHVLPVLFRTPDTSASEVDWRLARSHGWLMLVVENNGARRLRLSDVKLTQGGAVIARRDGFVGYVLPGLTRQWRVGRQDSYSGGLVTLSAKSNGSAIDAEVGVSGR
jgi:fimbrial chaperone protein